MKRLILCAVGIMLFSLLLACDGKIANRNVGAADVFSIVKDRVLDAPSAQFGLYRAKDLTGSDEKKGSPAAIIIIIVLAVGAVGAIVVFNMKRNAAIKTSAELDDFGDDD